MAAAARAAAAAGRAVPLLDALVVRSAPALRVHTAPDTPWAALDVTATHVSLAQSDASRTSAAPLGVLARTASARTDARILASALRHAAQHDDAATAASGLVVAVPPGADARDRVAAYVRELLASNDELALDPSRSADADGEDDRLVLFPRLQGVLFFSEAHALARTLRQRADFVHAAGIAPRTLERKLRNRYEYAMHRAVDQTDLSDGENVRARLSVSEVLQTVLDKLRAERGAQGSG